MSKKNSPVLIPVLFFLLLFFKQSRGQQLPNQSFTYLTSDHIKIPVKVSGKGFPCMFVPGGPGGGYISFEKLGGSALEKDLTMIYMDQRGSGSAQISANYSMDRILKDMDEIREKLHIEKMYLLAHSFGGIILINYAKKYPEHIKGLILANSTLHFFDEDATIEQIQFGYHLLGKDTIIKMQPQDSLIKEDLGVRQKMSHEHCGYKLLTDSPSTIKQLNILDSMYPRTNDFAYNIMVHIFDDTKPIRYPEYFTDYRPLSAKIKTSVLVISGSSEHAIGINHYKGFKFPNQRTVIINGGHLLYYEKNEEFVSAVHQFTNEVSRGG
jgi:proline iminopeptidase